MIRAAFVQACRAAAGETYTESLTKVLPDLLKNGGAPAAVALVRAAQFNNAALPEAMTLFSVPDLTKRDRYRMASAILPAAAVWQDDTIARLADCQARIGVWGFSFPLWRYLAQGKGQPSLLEKFGMEKLWRANDRYPDGIGNHMGAGFVHSDADSYIEYRQTYLVAASRVAGEEAALIIRNNSHFFGRDRLAHPVYAAWTALPDTTLAAISNAEPGPFLAWQKTMNEGVVPAVEKLHRIGRLLDKLDALDTRLHGWLWAEGREATLAFLRAATTGMATPPTLVTVDTRMPPWFPTRAMPAMGRILDIVEKDGAERIFGDSVNAPHTRLAILSSPGGDLPFSPAI